MMKNILLVDILVAVLATSFVAAQTAAFRRALKLGREEKLPGMVSGVVRCLAGRGRTFNKQDGGLYYMVLMAVGGVYIMMELAFVIAQPDSRVLEVLSLLGSMVVLLAGVSFIIFSVVHKLRKGYWMDLLPIIALVLIAFTRIFFDSLAESLLAKHLIYYFTVLFAVGAFPHGLASLWNIYFKNRGPMGRTRSLSLTSDPLGAATVEDLSWKSILDAQACANCGRCENNCPASLSGKRLSSRKIIQKVLQQTRATLKSGSPQSLHDAISQEEIWACSMCMACVKNCPLYIDHVRIILEMRRNSVLRNAEFPAETRTMLRNLELYGNVQGPSPRQQWALDLSLSRLSRLPQVTAAEPPEYLLWFGCAPEYIPKYQTTIRNMVRILRKAEVSFAVLGRGEWCCGDPARRLGEEEIFQNIARKNVQQLSRLKIRKIIAMCPHCFNTLKHDYPEYGAAFEVEHATEVIERLVDERCLDLRYPIEEKATLHDPCYLGRVNNLAGGLRKIMRSIPQLEFHELPRNSSNSYCCGGGGAKMWLHETPGNRIAESRVQEILATGCEVTATACPYCQPMLDAEMQNGDEPREHKFMDVIDMVAYSSGCDFEG